MRNILIVGLVVLGSIGCETSRLPISPEPPPGPSPAPSPVPLGPAPSISGVTPATAPAGSDDITIGITGSGFLEPSGSNAPNPQWTFVVWNLDQELLTRVVSDTEVTATIPAKLLKNPGLAQLIVVNGDSMGWSDGYHGYPQSGAVSFTVVDAR